MKITHKLFLLLCFTILVDAHEMYLGANLGTIRTKSTEFLGSKESEPYFRLQGAIAGEFQIRPDYFSVATEIGYARKGIETNDNFFHELDYLEIPILTTWTLFPEKPFFPKLYVGGSVGFLLHAEDNFSTDTTTDLHEEDLYPVVGTALVGTSLYYKLPKEAGNIGLDVRFYYTPYASYHEYVDEYRSETFSMMGYAISLVYRANVAKNYAAHNTRHSHDEE